MAVLSIDREGALAFRQRATYLDVRLPSDRLVDAAFAGLQDSSPRSAVLALHARVEDVTPSAWKDPRFLQMWGPRGAVYVVARDDVALFTLGLLPRDPVLREAIDTAAERIRAAFRRRPGPGRDMSDQEFRLSRSELRDASKSGTIRIHWDGSRTTWWIDEPPAAEPEAARLELARRFLRSLGPSTPNEFAWWSGVAPAEARYTFRSLGKELAEVDRQGRTSWILRTDRDALERAAPASGVRLLPPGDPYLAAGDREVLLPERRFRAELWPKSVWPGALMVDGELAGTWRRQAGRVSVRAWHKLELHTKAAVEREVLAMPVESARKDVRWVGLNPRP